MTEEFKKSFKISDDENQEYIILENYGRGYVIYGNPEFQKKYKEEYKKLGGKYNPNLKVGKGWIFGQKRLEELKLFLENNKL